MFPLTTPTQDYQEDDDCRGGEVGFPMPFTMVGMTDSSLVDLKTSRIGFHPSQTAPDKNKNIIPNGFST
jgi:hypothetical protein